jgi:hypothetical protein
MQAAAGSHTERDTNGRVPGPPPFPRPGRLARRVVGVNGGVCAIAARRRQAPLTPATRRGRSPAEGAATPNLLIRELLFWLVADRCDDLEFSDHERPMPAVVWCCPGGIK